MRRAILILSVLMLLMGSMLGGVAYAKVLDFEDLFIPDPFTPREWVPYYPISSPYHGFIMSDYAGFMTKIAFYGTGYEFGTTGYGSMYTAWGNPISLSGVSFNVVQLDATSAYKTGEDATFQGLKGGSLIYSTYVTGLSYTGPTTVSLNYTDIDTLMIIPGSLGTNSLLGIGPHLVIDNIVYSNVPIPGAVWLLGSGLLGLGSWRRFRKG